MTEREKDVEKALELIGKPDEYFKAIWAEFDPGYGWDGAECSEIACCISYLAGNIDTIPVANYAELLCNKFKNMGRFGKVPHAGDFIFFGYGAPEHTGRVVNVTDYTITTVEGNVSDHVAKRYYAYGNDWIYGYGYPEYAELELNTNIFFNNAKRDIFLFRDIKGYNNLIMMIQSYLKDKGYYSGYIDGLFGSYTDSAVREYQADNGLVIDGIVGRYTWENMINGN